MACKVCHNIRFGEIQEFSKDLVKLKLDGSVVFAPIRHTHTFSSCGYIEKFKEDYITHKGDDPINLLEIDLVDGHIVIRECIRSASQ